MATSKVLKPRRGSTAEHANFKGQAFEITFDTDKKTIVAHDGVTVGGFPLAREAAVTETDNALRALIEQKVSEIDGVSSSDLEAVESTLSSRIDANSRQQALRDAAQDDVIDVLNTTLRALIAEEVQKAMAAAEAAQGSADAAQTSADGKVSRAGDSIEWLQFPNGQLFSEPAPAIRGMVMEAARGNDIDGYGAMIAPRHALAIDNPGGIDLLTRNPDGTFGARGWMFRDGRFGWHGKNVVRSINGALADDAGNVQLIEFHSDMDVWWKRYSNGWIEQGGLIYASGKPYDIVTFPIPFASIPARGDFQMGLRSGAYPTGFYRMTPFADSMTRTTMNVFAKNGSNEIMSVTGFWSAYGF